jgi:hypothetical protein
MENKEFQKILTSAFKSISGVKDIMNGKSFDLDKLSKSIKAIPDYMAENIEKYPKEYRKDIMKDIKDLQNKSTVEGIMKAALKK